MQGQGQQRGFQSPEGHQELARGRRSVPRGKALQGNWDEFWGCVLEANGEKWGGGADDAELCN